MIYKEEHDLNVELWPHFMVFLGGIQSPNRQKRLDAFDTWHMTFKGLCLHHRRPDLYDPDRWEQLRAIHIRTGKVPALTDAGVSGGQATQPPQ